MRHFSGRRSRKPYQPCRVMCVRIVSDWSAGLVTCGSCRVGGRSARGAPGHPGQLRGAWVTRWRLRAVLFTCSVKAAVRCTFAHSEACVTSEVSFFVISVRMVDFVMLPKIKPSLFSRSMEAHLGASTKRRRSTFSRLLQTCGSAGLRHIDPSTGSSLETASGLSELCVFQADFVVVHLGDVRCLLLRSAQEQSCSPQSASARTQRERSSYSLPHRL